MLLNNPYKDQKTRRRKSNYLGKNKRHTQKAAIAVNNDIRITNISRVFSGKVHDIKIRKNSDKPFPNVNKYRDSKYQGLQNHTY